MINMKRCFSDIKKRRTFTEKQKETLKIYSSGIGMLLFLSVIYFHNLFAALVFLPYLHWWEKEQREKYKKKRQKQIRQEGKELLEILMNGLSVGYSMERSILAAQKEMHLLYPKGSHLMGGLKRMEHQIRMNQPVEVLFFEFAKETEDEDLIQFAFILRTAKKKGGNLIQILEKTIQTIRRKHQVEEEITTVLSGRTFEKNIMKAVPMFLICYMQIFNREYLTVMYETWGGRICMCLSLCMMLLSGKIADRIVEIGV